MQNLIISQGTKVAPEFILYSKILYFSYETQQHHQKSKVPQDQDDQDDRLDVEPLKGKRDSGSVFDNVPVQGRLRIVLVIRALRR